ncbi:MAG: DNA repair protein RecO [Aquabacterium sp.]|jgi:DNA repair protein RecO (recombination protein O)|uniref:DNA repair protein RecO n=1 Tax=Aquabacterium sp. TaxID=1872578 RepID=UPI001B6ECF74|nr:DNA repair protein RecO [Aquabacterium sp.]MBP7131764.1 DNA repair protein RecO [Aquabacterium sp.]MBP9062588.1 DNA repair protein RecO [Aquabacterium sp.]MDQ5926279.1 repair protein RecO [Pseudomonadota bacterium]
MARAASRPGSAAYVLHSHDWSESSLILELFTRDHGRVVAVAKGAKRPYSQLRPVLMPFQRLVVSFGAKRSEDAEVWLLRQAEWAGGPAWPGGAALLPGFYLNELLMRLMVRHDPHPALFDAYGQALQAMADPALLQAALRAFELILLRQLGHLPDLSMQTVTGQAVLAGQSYELHPELGVLPARWVGEPGVGPVAMDGMVLTEMETALSRPLPQPEALTVPSDAMSDLRVQTAVPALMAACMPALSDLKTVLRSLIHYHLGSQTLRTRQLMMELQHS